ncbi:MAG TPA: CAP domain-containing protein [Rhizobiales bacterium]|nr:CAP domain-containing protein [Hyphomicrobiales bacterium]
MARLTDADRRWLLTAGSASMLVVLAGCQGVLSLDQTEGSSDSAEAILAEIRARNGLPALSPDGRLERAARQQAGYMALSGRMEHRTGWGRDFAARMKANGIKGAAAENIAYGRWEPGELIRIWMASAPHRRNMLDPRFTRYGLGNAADGNGGRRYWALVLGS